jgi:hypothetical protein
MKYFSSIALASVLTISAFAQDSKTNADDATAQPAGQSLTASAAVVTAPLILTNDAISLNGDMADVTNGGTAVFTFSVATAGNYMFETLVNAPDENSNSFFVNVDGQPEDPDMVWDVDVTMGFQKRVMNWRGNGDSTTDQFTPKRFALTAGTHKLIIVGREPDTQLKSVTILPAPAQQPATP